MLLLYILYNLESHIFCLLSAERSVVVLVQEGQVDGEAGKYLNRCSTVA